MDEVSSGVMDEVSSGLLDEVSGGMDSSADDCQSTDLVELSAARLPVIIAGSIRSEADPAVNDPADGNPSNPDAADVTYNHGNELTIKYVQGLISFEDYISQNEMFQQLDEGEADDKPVGHDDTADDDEALEMEIEPLPSTSKSPGNNFTERKKRPRRIHCHLDKYLHGLMGEANLTFARGQPEAAIVMCMEVVRQAPRAPEPFQTLSMIYEETGEHGKAMQFLLIAAYLSPSDSEQWLKLADMAVEQGKIRDATQYYTKAIRSERSNIQLYWERSRLYLQLGDKDKALAGYQQILHLLDADGDNGDTYFQLSREIMKIQHEQDRLDAAIQAMDAAFTKYPLHITSEDVNVLVELNISMERFTRALEVIIETCGTQVTPSIGNERVLQGVEAVQYLREQKYTNVASVKVPEEIAIDIRVKLAICLIRLNLASTCEAVLAALLEESAEEMGDLYLDVAEAYMEMRVCHKAKPLLATLVSSQAYNLAAVWFLYGECLNALGELVNASEAFKKVVELAPQHFGARMALSAIQQQMGRPEEALRALTRELGKDGEELTGQDMRLLLHRCLLLHSQGNFAEFIDLSKKMLYSRFQSMLQDPTQVSLIMSYRSRKHRNMALKQYAERDKQSLAHETAYQEAMSVVPLDDIWELYLKVCQTLIDLERFQEFEDLSIVALTVPQFMEDNSKACEAEFICLVAFMMNKNGSFAFNFVKHYCLKDESNRAWNLMSQVICMMEDHRHNRFLMRLQLRNPDNLGLGLLNGHQSMVSSNFKYALGEYVAVFQQTPHDPLISLCIGLVFVNLVSGKLAKKRHILVQQGCAFLNHYVELRGECQEAYYNLGRAMQQLGLLHAAVYYYGKGLSLPPAILGEEQHLFDLTKELAHNLSMIYKNSKSHYMARLIAEKYLVV